MHASRTRLFVVLCLALLGLILLGPLGCSTAVLKSRALFAQDSTPWSGSAILLNYDLKNGDGSPVTDDCTLIFSVAGSAASPNPAPHDVSVALPGGIDRVFVDAPAGHYEWKSLSCSAFNRWMLGAMSGDGFDVTDGKIGFVGRAAFQFPRKEDPQQILTAGIGGQDSATQSLAIDLQSFPPAWKSALENPYTRKPITEAMLAPKGIYRMQVHVSQHLPHGMPAVSTQGLEKALKLCDEQEQKRFPYRLGSLDYTATYSDAKLQKVDKSGENSFSDDFLSCIDQSLQAYVPAQGVALKVTILL